MRVLLARVWLAGFLFAGVLFDELPMALLELLVSDLFDEYLSFKLKEQRSDNVAFVPSCPHQIARVNLQEKFVPNVGED